MWMSILTVVIVSILEDLSLKSYRAFGKLPESVRKRDFCTIWISAAVILIPLLLGAFGVPLPGLVWVK